MDLIDEFIARYTKEYDFYSQVSLMAHRTLEATLREEGIRAIVTSRAKSIDRLAEKCRRRDQEGENYQSITQIYGNIHDLADVRVALYFPAEAEQVDGMISRLFHEVSPKSKHSGPWVWCCGG